MDSHMNLCIIAVSRTEFFKKWECCCKQRANNLSSMSHRNTHMHRGTLATLGWIKMNE